MRRYAIGLLAFLLCSCTVGPNYVRPCVQTPVKFKEVPKGWKVAEPKVVNCNNAEWWKIFNDPLLNSLEPQVALYNQNIKSAAAVYEQAYYLVQEARAAYYPTLDFSGSLVRQKRVASSTVSSSTTSFSPTGGTILGTTTGGSSSSVTTSHTLLLDALWEPDIWGQVKRTVEAAQGGANANGALFAATKLSMQATLAQSYFSLRALDTDQKLLDDTVRDYKAALKITKNQYTSGTAQRTDVLQAQSLLESAEALAINNGISRGKFEHAIAVLIGKPPECFSLPRMPLTTKPPIIPLEMPSTLLERRPDVAQAEYLAIQANAQIGVAISAFYPTLSLSGTASMAGANYAHWFSLPMLAWAVGPQLAQNLFDGGLRQATTDAARANYQSTVALYRQAVLAAFQDVEDNLVSIRLLQAQVAALNKAAADAKRAEKLILNQYKAGTVAYSSVLTAQINAYTAQKTAADVVGLQMASAVGLIKALGGGWDGVLRCS